VETIGTTAQDDKHFIDWETYGALIRLLGVELLKHGRTFSGVYGLPRGGSIIAVALSHFLGIPFVTSKENIEPETLIVDDLVDTGAQLSAYPNNFKATLICKPWGIPKPDLYIYATEAWVVYPYEEAGTSTVRSEGAIGESEGIYPGMISGVL